MLPLRPYFVLAEEVCKKIKFVTGLAVSWKVFEDGLDAILL